MRMLSTRNSWDWSWPGDGVHFPVTATATPVESLTGQVSNVTLLCGERWLGHATDPSAN